MNDESLTLEQRLARLREPFGMGDIEWRPSRIGGTAIKPWIQVVAYVDARAIMDRLDEVMGPVRR